jgi:hypothetical protein
VRHDFHFAFAVSRQPDPSAAELAYTGGVEFFLESLEVAKGLLDYVGDGAGGIASAMGLHDVPEHGVVDVAAAIVADGAADVFGNGVQVADQIFGAFLVQFGMLVERRVQVLDVGGVVHVVMQVHRLFVDGGFERRVVIRQGGQFMRHFHFLQRGGSLKVLLLENISGVAASQFEEAGFEVESLKGALEERELVEKCARDFDSGVRSKTHITAAVLDAAPELVSVGAFCIGVDKIDRAASSERGIGVFNDPHSNSRSVAELAMGEIILLLRRTFEASTQLHSGVWNKSSAGSHEVRGLTLGIVGYGKDRIAGFGSGRGDGHAGGIS